MCAGYVGLGSMEERAMRWWAIVPCALLGMLWLAGCSEPPAQPPVTLSLLTFRYDPSWNMAIAITRDAVISPMGTVTTSTPVVMKTAPIGVVSQQSYSLPTTNYPTANPQERQDFATIAPSYTPTFASPALGPLDYANALASLPEMSIAPSMFCSFNSPIPTVCGKVLTVNYTTPCDPENLSEAEATAVLVSMEAWWWVPYICDVHLQANCEPLTELGPFTFHDPWEREYHTYLVQEQTGEVGYEFGAPGPADLAEAMQMLAQQDIGMGPATKGFTPLIPPEVTCTVYPSCGTDGVLRCDLSGNFPISDRFRLAGLVMMLTQFPCINAVQFTFCGRILDYCFMRSNLNKPLTVTDLILPSTVAMPPSLACLHLMQCSAQQALGYTPASYGDAQVWQQWATLHVVPAPGVNAQLCVLHKVGDAYQVLSYGADLDPRQLLQQGMPRDAIIALQLPHWEDVLGVVNSKQ